jgi:RNA 3'-terminal phosphate cyclase (ATP)
LRVGTVSNYTRPWEAKVSETVQIDGSYGEGGGQIIRTSLSLAVLTGRPVHVSNVRARRSRPGLQPQHLTAVRAAASLCAAELKGDAVGSTSFVFAPQAPVQAGDYRFNIGTAGAASLVAQTVLVPLSHAGAPSRVVIIGGTHVPHAPPADYLGRVYLPALRRAGLEAEVDYPKAGFFPKGGGEVVLSIAGVPASTALNLVDRGKLRTLSSAVVTSNLGEHVSQRGADTVTGSAGETGSGSGRGRGGGGGVREWPRRLHGPR